MRRERWDRLAALADRAAGRGIRSLRPDEIDELALTYRAAASDLAIARARGEDPAVLGFLNRLTARAHAVVYAATTRGGWSRMWQFAARDFPREARRSWIPIAACILLTVVSTIISYVSVAHDPANAGAFGFDEGPITKSLHDSNFGFDRAYSASEAAHIITNNVRIAAVAFAGGITAGLLTVWIILENGLMLGATSEQFAHAGFGADFWATIAPHGVIELTAIQIAGGAGLILAGGYLRPGRARRADALVIAARRAAVLVGGVTLMLCIAGTIEGFISPQRISIAARGAIGTITAVGMIFYFLGAGRSEQPAGLDGDVGVEQRRRQFGGGNIDDQHTART